jgi:hypothetical protein
VEITLRTLSIGAWIAHSLGLATWFPGRLGLSGKEIDQQTRNFVLAKDALFFVGALTGLASVIQGRALSGQAPEGAVPIESGATPAATTPEKAADLLRSVNQLSNVNIAVTGAILGITMVLSMKATESTPFSVSPVSQALRERRSGANFREHPTHELP